MAILSELNDLIYYIVVQFRLIFPYWIAGLIAGSVISVFASYKIRNLVLRVNTGKYWVLAGLLAALLGAASPICMYGTVPLIATLGRKGVSQHLLVSFMVTSILINPNLFILSFALGTPLALVRMLVCIIAGILAGVIVRIFFKNRAVFGLDGFEDRKKCSTGGNRAKVFLGDLNRAITKTAPYFLAGILLTALFEMYFPKDIFIDIFDNNRGLGVLLASSFGVPVYICGGGTVPLLKAWISAGMSPGSAIAFMISGPATKLTNLGAVKIILGVRNFVFYILFNIAFSVTAGFSVDAVYSFLK